MFSRIRYNTKAKAVLAVVLALLFVAEPDRSVCAVLAFVPAPPVGDSSDETEGEEYEAGALHVPRRIAAVRPSFDAARLPDRTATVKLFFAKRVAAKHLALNSNREFPLRC
jgi:hypothetical protein